MSFTQELETLSNASQETLNDAAFTAWLCLAKLCTAKLIATNNNRQASSLHMEDFIECAPCVPRDIIKRIAALFRQETAYRIGLLTPTEKTCATLTERYVIISDEDKARDFFKSFYILEIL